MRAETVNALSPEVRRVVDAITASVLCCDCLVRDTGLTALAVRGSLLIASRSARLDTWTACRSCGAVQETYGITEGRGP